MVRGRRQGGRDRGAAGMGARRGEEGEAPRAGLCFSRQRERGKGEWPVCVCECLLSLSPLLCVPAPITLFSLSYSLSVCLSLSLSLSLLTLFSHIHPPLSAHLPVCPGSPRCPGLWPQEDGHRRRPLQAGVWPHPRQRSPSGAREPPRAPREGACLCLSRPSSCLEVRRLTAALCPDLRAHLPPRQGPLRKC